MPLLNNISLKKFNNSFIFYLLQVGFLSLWISPFIVSLTTFFSLVYVVLTFNNYSDKRVKVVCYLSFIILLTHLASMGIYGASDTLVSKLLLVVGFIALLSSSFLVFDAKKNHLILFSLVISGIVFVINIYAITNYLVHKAHYDALLLQSKSIPIPNMHHIHFGIINACILFLLLGLLVQKKIPKIWHRNLAKFMLVVIAISFHILSSRTGLLSFYVGAFVSVIAYSIQKRSYSILLYSFLSIIITLGLSVQYSDSFRNKIKNSLEDYNSWGKGDEINHKSMGMRIEASTMAIHVIKAYPFGVGIEKKEQALQAMYVKKNTPLDLENRIGPHNQFLDYGMKFGWIGIGILLIFFISLIPLIQNASFPMLGISVVFLVALFFESLFERQTSIFTFCMFIPLFYSLFGFGSVIMNKK